MAEDMPAVVQWFRERLAHLATLYPELKTGRARERLAAELRRQTEEECDGTDDNREA
jgi:hypothetical protein